MKIRNLATLRDDMLKIRLKNQIIRIEMSWPTKERDVLSIGPFLEKVRKNAVQVSRKGNLIIITLGKSQKRKWGRLYASDAANEVHFEHFSPKAAKSGYSSNQLNFHTFSQNFPVPNTSPYDFLPAMNQKNSSEPNQISEGANHLKMR